MNRNYIAVPLLVYVPTDHRFATDRGQEYTAGSVCDFLNLTGVTAFAASDYHDTDVSESPDHELSDEIHQVCPWRTHIAKDPIQEALAVLLRALPHFDAQQCWEGHADALDYCARQDNPEAALFALVLANYLNEERGWAGELLKQAPETWKKPEISPLDAACGLLARVFPASYEHPGFISLEHNGIDFAIGDSNGDYTIDFAPVNHTGPRSACPSTLNIHASPTRLAHWIREQVLALAPPPPLPLPPFHRMQPCPEHIAREVLAIETDYWMHNAGTPPDESYLGYIPNYSTTSPGFHGELVIIIWPAAPNCIDIYRRQSGTTTWQVDRNVGNH